MLKLTNHTVLKFLTVTLSFVHVGLLSAQAPDSQKFEGGLGYSLIRTNFLSDFDKTESGIVGRLGYNFHNHISLEAEFNFFPQDIGVLSKGLAEGLFGPKAGWRFQRVGVFGKLRPGFIHFQERQEPFPCPAVLPPPLWCVVGGRTEFVTDAGGVLEFYPHSRTTLRVDAGDNMIRFRIPVQRFGPPDPNGVRASTIVNGFWSHNFQFGTSVSFRF